MTFVFKKYYTSQIHEHIARILYRLNLKKNMLKTHMKVLLVLNESIGTEGPFFKILRNCIKFIGKLVKNSKNLKS